MHSEVCSESKIGVEPMESPCPTAPREVHEGKKKRPMGVSILAVLNMVGAVLLILAALGAGSELDDPGIASAYGAILGLFGVFSLMIAIGLWRLRNWARITAVIMYGISAVISLVELCQGSSSGFIQLVVAGSIAAYLCRAPARGAFCSQDN